jgi:hypothetical protein
VKNVDSDKQSWQTIEHLDNKLIAGRLAIVYPLATIWWKVVLHKKLGQE